ncbi:hypothetical protein ACNQFN_21085 [Thauera butanivorans]|uniref:hypothetical protein n=1 Tax=Thauera butanivorans TaxID=86174 RepID=UPI003AB60A3E
MDKLLPAFMRDRRAKRHGSGQAENRAEKLGLVTDANAWLATRMLRNRLVHEYVEDLAELATALSKARALVPELIQCHQAIQDYTERIIGTPDHAQSSSPR